MSEQDDRDALGEVLAGTVSQLSYSVSESELNPGAIQTFRAQFTVPRGWQAKALADAALASDWLAQRDRQVAAEAVLEFVAWIARARAHNGSDRQFGQSLYNECINAALPVWAAEWIERGE